MDCLDIHPAFVCGACVYQSFLNGFVGVLQFHIFTHQSDAYFTFGILQAPQEFLPFAQFRLGEILNLEFTDRQLVQMLFVQIERYLVDTPRIDALDYVSGLDITEERDLATEIRCKGLFGPAYDHIGFDATLLKHLH